MILIVAALMLLTSCVFSPPSKDKVVAYAEKEFGKTPEILSVKRKEWGKTVIYKMRLEGEELIFTVGFHAIQWKLRTTDMDQRPLRSSGNRQQDTGGGALG